MDTSALTNFPADNTNYWTALFANQGSGDFAGYFNGNVRVDGIANTTFSGSEFSALKNLSQSNVSSTIYAKNGNATYAGYFDGNIYLPGGNSICFNSNINQGYRLKLQQRGHNAYIDYFDSLYFRSGNPDSTINISFSSDGKVTMGPLPTTLPSNSSSVDIFGFCSQNSDRNFRVTSPGINLLSGTEFSALANINVNGNYNWTALYANSGTNTGNYAGYFDGNGMVFINGNVGIGTTNSTLGKLAVKGKVVCEEVLVQTSVPASDYVFEKNYKLKSLKDIESYIKEYKHLPEVPSADEFKKNGCNMGEMDNILLKKIEELTLYMIDLKKENDQLKERISKLEK